jgi:hypothetical protein
VVEQINSSPFRKKTLIDVLEQHKEDCLAKKGVRVGGVNKKSTSYETTRPSVVLADVWQIFLIRAALTSFEGRFSEEFEESFLAFSSRLRSPSSNSSTEYVSSHG